MTHRPLLDLTGTHTSDEHNRFSRAHDAAIREGMTLRDWEAFASAWKQLPNGYENNQYYHCQISLLSQYFQLKGR